jgi:hypothetical protein
MILSRDVINFNYLHNKNSSISKKIYSYCLSLQYKHFSYTGGTSKLVAAIRFSNFFAYNSKCLSFLNIYKDIKDILE